MERQSGLKINSESINEDFFKRNKKNKVALKRKQVIGTIIAMTGMVAAFGMAAEVSERMAKEDVRVEAEENSNKDLTYAGSTNLEVPLVGLGKIIF